jgi:hypothetical protein
MQGPLLFVLPEGRSAEVTRPNAESICDRLWEQGIQPGAATAATRITEALQRAPLFGNELDFNQRELTPLLDAAQEVNLQTWADLLQASNLAAIAPSQRRCLRATCEDLIADLAPHGTQDKLGALRRDLERLRDKLHATY